MRAQAHGRSYSRRAWPVCEVACCAHVFGRALGHDQAAGVAALGAEVDQPVGRADHVQVVLDHDQRVAAVDQLAQRAHELGNVVKVQAGGGLVKQEQRALAWPRLAAAGGGLGGAGQKARELEALRLAARQRGHGLAQLHVFQPHVHDGLQRADHVAVVRKQAAASLTVRSSTSATFMARGISAPTGCARSSLPESRGGSVCRRSPGSAGTRRSGTAFPHAQSPSRRRWGNARRRC
jgi:hypothetical protein